MDYASLESRCAHKLCKTNDDNRENVTVCVTSSDGGGLYEISLPNIRFFDSLNVLFFLFFSQGFASSRFGLLFIITNFQVSPLYPPLWMFVLFYFNSDILSFIKQFFFFSPYECFDIPVVQYNLSFFFLYSLILSDVLFLIFFKSIFLFFSSWFYFSFFCYCFDFLYSPFLS